MDDMYQNAVAWVIDKIEEKFGEMTVTRGKSHNSLGMKFDFVEDKTVTVGMDEGAHQGRHSQFSRGQHQ